VTEIRIQLVLFGMLNRTLWPSLAIDGGRSQQLRSQRVCVAVALAVWYAQSACRVCPPGEREHSLPADDDPFAPSPAAATGPPAEEEAMPSAAARGPAFEDIGALAAAASVAQVSAAKEAIPAADGVAPKDLPNKNKAPQKATSDSASQVPIVGHQIGSKCPILRAK
jgi:hypothetical protein